MLLKRLALSLVALVLCWRTANAQDGLAVAKKPTGSISGRVFLITRGGDIKPARYAHVYLMGLTPNQHHESAISVFQGRQISGLDALIKDAESGSAAADSEEARCQKKLLVVTESLQASERWAESNKGASRFTGVQTDEDGEFQISGISLDIGAGEVVEGTNPDKTKIAVVTWGFKIAVQGRAGANDAYWVEDVTFYQIRGKFSAKWGVTTVPGRDVFVKLGSPSESCLSLDE